MGVPGREGGGRVEEWEGRSEGVKRRRREGGGRGRGGEGGGKEGERGRI